MYSEAFDHLHSGMAADDAVYTDPDTLQSEIRADRLSGRRSRGRGTGFRKKQVSPQLEIDDDMGQTHTTEYIDVFDTPSNRHVSPQRKERARSDGQILQNSPRFERGHSHPSVSLRGHTEEDSSDYCFAVEPLTEPPDLRKKSQVEKRVVSIRDDYSQPQDKLTNARCASQDYTEPYELAKENTIKVKKPPSPDEDQVIYEFAKEPLCKATEEYDHLPTAGNNVRDSGYDHIDTLHKHSSWQSQTTPSSATNNSPTKLTSPAHKQSGAQFFPSQSSTGANKMQQCHYGDIPANYEEPWDSHAGQRKLSRLLERAEKKDDRRQSLDKQSASTDQKVAGNITRRNAGSRTPSVSHETAGVTTVNPSKEETNDVYETSWGPTLHRNSLEKQDPNISPTRKQSTDTSTQPSHAPTKHAPIPSNYEEAWDTPVKQREFEEKLEQARKQRTSKGKIREDNDEETQGDINKSPIAKFSPEATKVPVLPAPRIRPVAAKRENYTRSDSCRSLGALAEKIDKNVPLQDQIFYHGAIKRSDAEKMLLVFKEGSYLIRRSETSKQDFSLTLKGWNGIAMHMKIVTQEDGTYVLGENSPPFSTIPEMVDFYTTHELPVQNAERICLLYPIPC